MNISNSDFENLSSYQKMLVEMAVMTGEKWQPEVYVNIALGDLPAGLCTGSGGLSLSVDTSRSDTLLRLLGYLDVAKENVMRRLSVIVAPDLPEPARRVRA